MSFDIRRPLFRSYPHLLEAILEHGETVECRTGPTRELRGATYRFTPGDMVSRPGFSRRLGWLEMLHLLAGTFSQADFTAVAPKVKEGFFTANMAYGPRIQPHFTRVSEMLVADPVTRRAELLLADNNFDNKDLPPPCTTSIHFLIRDNTLLTFVEMRSWDAWLGLPYDIMMFGGVAIAMATAVDCFVGPVEVHTSSLHLYERQFSIDPQECDTRFAQYTLSLNIALNLALDSGHMGDYWASVKRQAEDDLALIPWKETRPRLIRIDFEALGGTMA